MVVECCLGINTEQLHRVIKKMDLGSPETVIVHVGTNDLRTTRNLDCVMREEETHELQTCPEWSVAT